MTVRCLWGPGIAMTRVRQFGQRAAENAVLATVTNATVTAVTVAHATAVAFMRIG